MIIRLTEKARGLEDRYEEVSQEMNRLFYRGMTQQDADALDTLLERVLQNLQELTR